MLGHQSYPLRPVKQRKTIMRKNAFTTPMLLGAALGAIALPAAAQAQNETPKPEVTIGASAGIHDLSVDFEDNEIEGFDPDDSAEIYGGFAAVDFPVSKNLFIGAEGNFHFGSGPIEAEYGALGRFGVRTDGGSKIFLRGGYQWVDIDLQNLTGDDEDVLDDNNVNIDDVAGDYLVGAGVEFPVGQLVLRANVDTLAFDPLRGTVGVGLKF
jgi:opacity protein-like surface antigen